MPWEVDHGLIIAHKLKEIIYYINPEDTIYVNTTLNLSSHIINWEESKLPKEFFIEKYNIINKLLGNRFIVTSHVYDGDKLYGCLDCQRESKQTNIDYYMSICPDVDFPPTLIYYMLESAKKIKNKYFFITPQIAKCWDSSWDVMVNKNFINVPYDKYTLQNSHEINHVMQQEQEHVKLMPIDIFKFSGWCDLYSKEFHEKIVPILPEWNGYGPWDMYSMYVCNICKQHNLDIKQYILENQVIWFYDSGDLKGPDLHLNDGVMKRTYKNFIKTNINKNEQRNFIEQNLNFYINKWIQYAKDNNII